MTSDPADHPVADAAVDRAAAVLPDLAGVDASAIDLHLAATSQVQVVVPALRDDGSDDGVVDDEVAFDDDPAASDTAPEMVAEGAPVPGVEIDEPDADVPAASAADAGGSAPVSGEDASSRPDGQDIVDAQVVASHDPVAPPRPDDHPRRTVATRAAVPASKRIDQLDAGRESPDLLTPDRLLDPVRVVRPEPEGAWQHLLYAISGGRLNLGDGKRARARKDLDGRIATALPGGARFVPVLSRKGGVGKTTVTVLLGMALADARDDRVIAIDANPDRGTLAERIAGHGGSSVRDLARHADAVAGFNDVSTLVARDRTRLDVLSSDPDPRVSEAFGGDDYRDVARLAAHYYSIVLTDTGTGIVHSVMAETLDLAAQVVVVCGLSVDEARLASETLSWLESNGFAAQARDAVVVLNTARPGTPLVREDELETHFRTRVRAVVRLPYDPHIAAGSAIAFHELQPATRLAARQLAAVVVEGLRQTAAAA